MAGAAASTRTRPRTAASQPRARSGGRATRRGGIHWDRVGRMALLAVLAVILVLYIPPVTHWVQQSRTADRSQQQVHELELERARLKARLGELSGPGAIEREARKLGMTKRDERPYVVQPQRSRP
jgi:cell division protein FtsB